MKTLNHAVGVRPVRNSRPGRPAAPLAAGLCHLALMELTDDCSVQGRRRRSEIAQALSQGEALQVVVLAA